jgi:hypothetical protein
MFTTRSDVVKALGPFTLPTLPQLQHKPIEYLLLADPLSFDIVAPASELVLLQEPSEFRKHNPHLLGYFKGTQVWAVSGLSPTARKAEEYPGLNTPLEIPGVFPAGYFQRGI